MKMAARVIDVHKDYVLKGGIVVRALRGVSIDFPEGDFVAIMGASGSGKSMLLNLLGCLDRAPGANISSAVRTFRNSTTTSCRKSAAATWASSSSPITSSPN